MQTTSILLHHVSRFVSELTVTRHCQSHNKKKSYCNIVKFWSLPPLTYSFPSFWYLSHFVFFLVRRSCPVSHSSAYEFLITNLFAVFPFYEYHHYPVDHSFMPSVFSRSFMSQHFTFVLHILLSFIIDCFSLPLLGYLCLILFPKTSNFADLNWNSLNIHRFASLLLYL